MPKIVSPSSPAPVTTSASSSPIPVTVVTADASVAANRTLPVVPAASIPSPAAGFIVPTGPRNKRGLRRPNAAFFPQSLAVLQEATTQGTALQTLLGKNAPDATQAAPLVARATATGASRAKAQALLICMVALDEIAQSDLAGFIQAEAEGFRAAVKHDATLAQTLPALANYLALTRQAIATGKAQAKAREDAATAAATEATAAAQTAAVTPVAAPATTTATSAKAPKAIKAG